MLCPCIAERRATSVESPLNLSLNPKPISFPGGGRLGPSTMQRPGHLNCFSFWGWPPVEWQDQGPLAKNFSF